MLHSQFHVEYCDLKGTHMDHQVQLLNLSHTGMNPMTLLLSVRCLGQLSQSQWLLSAPLQVKSGSMTRDPAWKRIFLTIFVFHVRTNVIHTLVAVRKMLHHLLPRLKVWVMMIMASNCARGGLGWTLGNIYSLKELLSIGTTFPGKFRSHHPWIC